MPISFYPSFSNRHQGFTLIEILVVLFIVTIMVGLVVTRLPAFGSNADFDLEAKRLHMLMKMARNDAMLDSVEYGFKTTSEGYEFLVFDDATQKWEKAVSPFHARRLGDDMRLSVQADNDAYEGLGESLPPVLILSSGETTPFRMTLTSKQFDARQVLITDGYDEIRWQQDE